MQVVVGLGKPCRDLDVGLMQSTLFGNQCTDLSQLFQRKKKIRHVRYRTFHELYITADQKLGEGSFGKVVAYQNVETSQEVAVKVVSNLKKRDRAKVLKEVEVIHRCGKHVNIVEMKEFFEETDVIYMVFEKLDGGTLLHNVRKQESLTEGNISDVLREITRGLQCLHNNGIAHRDLKPSNIVCVYPGQLTPLKLIDFDLASEYIYDSNNPQKCVSTPRLRSPVGSFEYMAPDVVNIWRATELDWSHTYDKRCDLWSLGVILYLALCGCLPFQGKDCGRDCGWRGGHKCDECQELLFDEILMGHYEFPDEEWLGISDDAKHLVSKLLVTNPLHRFTAAEVLGHVWVSDERHQARCNVLRYSSRRSMRNRANELITCVENANIASRLVHLHFNLETSSVDVAAGETKTEDSAEPSKVTEITIGDCFLNDPQGTNDIQPDIDMEISNYFQSGKNHKDQTHREGNDSVACCSVFNGTWNCSNLDVELGCDQNWQQVGSGKVSFSNDDSVVLVEDYNDNRSTSVSSNACVCGESWTSRQVGCNEIRSFGSRNVEFRDVPTDVGLPCMVTPTAGDRGLVCFVL